MVRPVSSAYRVTLGYRQQAQFDPDYIHRGIDYGCPEGTPVVATRAGTVVFAGWGGGYGSAYGLQVIIRTGDIWHLYAHLSSESVSVGQWIETGQQLGRSGKTGNTRGAHLHYQECTQPPSAYRSDRAPQFITYTDTPAVPTDDTVFDVSFWGQAYERWFGTSWESREAEITRELRGSEPGTEASVHGFTEVYDLEQVITLRTALGEHFTRVAGRAGLELWFDSTKWEFDPEHPLKEGGYASGIQNRYALVVHLIRKSTGQHVAFVVFHGPITYDSLKTAYGQWLARLLATIDGPILLMGDANRSVEDKSPRKEIRALGFRDMRDQAAIVNESAKEFPSRDWTLSDIWTDTNDATDDRIVGGIIDLTSARVSDHRRIEARVRVAA